MMLTFSSVRLLLVIVVGLRGSQKNDETQDGPKAHCNQCPSIVPIL